MPDCYMMLIAVLNDLPSLQGIISFSCFMLPRVRSGDWGYIAPCSTPARNCTQRSKT